MLVVAGTSLVRVKNIICIAYFHDSSAGTTYNISELVTILYYSAGSANLDYAPGAVSFRFPYQNAGIDYNILGNVNASGRIDIDGYVDGGDVLAKTGITPGAGDTVDFALSMLYEPL
jgi:hypothetical protein